VGEAKVKPHKQLDDQLQAANRKTPTLHLGEIMGRINARTSKHDKMVMSQKGKDKWRMGQQPTCPCLRLLLLLDDLDDEDEVEEDRDVLAALAVPSPGALEAVASASTALATLPPKGSLAASMTVAAGATASMLPPPGPNTSSSAPPKLSTTVTAVPTSSAASTVAANASPAEPTANTSSSLPSLAAFSIVATASDSMGSDGTSDAAEPLLAQACWLPRQGRFHS